MKIISCLVWILKIEFIASLVSLFYVCSSYGLNIKSYVPCIICSCLSKLWLKYLEFCPLYYILLSVQVIVSKCSVLSHALHFIRPGNKKQRNKFNFKGHQLMAYARNEYYWSELIKQKGGLLLNSISCLTSFLKVKYQNQT